MHASTAFVMTWSGSMTGKCTEQHYIVNTVHGKNQCCMTEKKYQTDGDMYIMQVFMETGTV